VASRKARARAIATAVVVACLTPALWLGWLAYADELGANPIEEITHVTGAWTLRMLVLTLGVTPARKLFGWSWLAPQRRTLGLFSFFYATLHLLTYAVLDLGLELEFLAEDILERPYITVGFATFCSLLPLALTSTRAAIKALGRRWLILHRLVYLAAIGGVVHFLWLVKADLREPLIYAAIVAALLGWRALQSRWLRSLRTERLAAG
jgi:sulfoxide reductase heme-binding subunit YedZ